MIASKASHILAASIGFLALAGTAYGVMYGLIAPRIQGECYGVGLLFCLAQALPIAVGAAIVVEAITLRWLLRKWGIYHSLTLAILAPVTMLILYFITSKLWSELQLNIWVQVVACGVFFVASFLFYDWYLNGRPGKSSSKILHIIAGLGTIAIIGMVVNFYT